MGAPSVGDVGKIDYIVVVRIPGSGTRRGTFLKRILEPSLRDD